jgi:hypothetical protein
MGATCSLVVEVQLSAGVWTDITADTVQADGMEIRYGIQGNGPTDCVASAGECHFSLNNSASNSAKKQGYYSPLNTNCRTGWTFGIPLRVTITSAGTPRVKFRGKVGVIDPDPGSAGPKKCRVVAYDGMYDLIGADVRSVAIQVGQSESALISAVLDSLDSTTQPVSRSIDAGVDTFPYAFYDIGDGQKALTLIQKAAVNSFGLVAMKGDGTFIFRSRASRATGASSYTFTDSMRAMTAPSDLSEVYNVVRVTTHPKNVDAAATTVLWAATGPAPSIPPGGTFTLWATYRDPSNLLTLIGGINVVNPLVSGTDYAGNAASDGSGADLSASLSVTLTPFASTAKIDITNTHPTSMIFLVDGAGNVKLQVRGKGVYDRGPQTFEASSAAAYGTQPINIDLDYQSDDSIAQSYATYVQSQYKDLSSRVNSLTIIANNATDFMAQVLDREPGDIVTVTETVTGITLVDVVIQSITLEISPGPWVVCTWTFAPAAPFKAWVLGVAGRSELGDTTRIGF